jgi:hypothetical protein
VNPSGHASALKTVPDDGTKDVFNVDLDDTAGGWVKV